jgi:hypothetical protein
MDLIVENVDVWAAAIEDQPGALARKLTGLKEAGADLNFVIARRAPEKPGTGVVFVTPIRGDREIEAAAELGFNVTTSLRSLSIEGENKPGIAAEISQIIADADVNLRGLSAAVIGTRFVIYIALDSEEEAQKTAELLKTA